MDNTRLGVEIAKTIYNHPNDRLENIGRENAPLEALLQHPKGLTERIEDQAGVVSMRS